MHGLTSAADVKIEIPVLVRSLKSSILSSNSFQIGKTFWGVGSLGVKPTWLLRETGNSALEADPRIPPKNAWAYLFLEICKKLYPLT